MGLALGLAVLGSGLARAAEPEQPFAEPGPYVGFAAAVGGARSTESTAKSGAGSATGWTLTALGGYRMSRFWAAEGVVDYTDARSFALVDHSDALRLAAASANAKLLMWPGRLQPYVSAGFGGSYSRADQQGIRDEQGHVFGRGAVGVDLYMSETSLLNVEANGASGTSEYRTLGVRLGMGVRF